MSNNQHCLIIIWFPAYLPDSNRHVLITHIWICMIISVVISSMLEKTTSSEESTVVYLHYDDRIESLIQAGSLWEKVLLYTDSYQLHSE